MPIYEYVCNSCGRSFEKRVTFSTTVTTCNSCSSDNVQRQLSAPAIHFKGSGWYINDSKKSSSSTSSESSSATATASSSSTDD